MALLLVSLSSELSPLAKTPAKKTADKPTKGDKADAGKGKPFGKEAKAPAKGKGK